VGILSETISLTGITSGLIGRAISFTGAATGSFLVGNLRLSGNNH
jgi:hypothetical protein